MRPDSNSHLPLWRCTHNFGKIWAVNMRVVPKRIKEGNMMVSSANRRWVLVVPVLLLVTWLAASSLKEQSFWYDEWWSLYDAGAVDHGPLSPIEIVQRVATKDPYQSPGYYLILAGWGSLTGWSEYSGRALSLLTGLLAVAVTYQLGQTLTGEAEIEF